MARRMSAIDCVELDTKGVLGDPATNEMVQIEGCASIRDRFVTKDFVEYFSMLISGKRTCDCQAGRL